MGTGALAPLRLSLSESVPGRTIFPDGARVYGDRCIGAAASSEKTQNKREPQKDSLMIAISYTYAF